MGKEKLSEMENKGKKEMQTNIRIKRQTSNRKNV